MDDFWSEKYVLTDLLFDTNKSIEEIAEYLECSKSELSKNIKLLGLDWVRRPNKKMSRGQAALTSILKKILPSEEIVNEYHIGERLRVDIYCPKYNLGIEYHGRQHFEHISMFHETYDDFLRAKQRDERKIELCRNLGISLVVFKYTDKLTEDVVYDRIIEVVRSNIDLDKAVIKKKHSSVKNHPNYQSLKLKRKEFEKDVRRRIKQEQKARAKEKNIIQDKPELD